MYYFMAEMSLLNLSDYKKINGRNPLPHYRGENNPDSYLGWEFLSRVSYIFL